MNELIYICINLNTYTGTCFEFNTSGYIKLQSLSF